jgi:hypothetical protein
MYRTRPSATFGYMLTGFADNEDTAENIGLIGTMIVRGMPTTISNAGKYVIEYAGGLSSNAGFTFAPGTGLPYTVEKQPINVDDFNPIPGWQSEREPGGQKVPVGENHFTSFNRKIDAFAEKRLIIQRAVKWSERAGIIAGNTIALQEIADAFFIFPLPDDIFLQRNPDAIISLEAHSLNGSSLPSWLSFDPKLRVISGKAPKEAKGEYLIELVAKDRFGDETRSVMLLKIG